MAQKAQKKGCLRDAKIMTDEADAWSVISLPMPGFDAGFIKLASADRRLDGMKVTSTRNDACVQMQRLLLLQIIEKNC